MGRLAVIANKRMELDAHGRKTKLLGGPAISTDAIAWKASELSNLLLGGTHDFCCFVFYEFLSADEGISKKSKLRIVAFDAKDANGYKD